MLRSVCVTVLNGNQQVLASEHPKEHGVGICYGNTRPKTSSVPTWAEICWFALVYF